METNPVKIKVLIVDDHAIMREGLRTLLSGRGGMDVVGEASNGMEALSQAQLLDPDVVVLDISMPGMNGIETARRMAESNPRVKIVALSAHTDRRFVAEMLGAGAKGYLPKDDAFDELALAVHVAMKGQTYISPSVTDDMVQDYVTRLPKHVPMPHEALSPREREVMLHLADGKNVKEIGFAMDISPKTVDTFRRRLMAKLDARSNADVTKYAIRSGLTLLE